MGAQLWGPVSCQDALHVSRAVGQKSRSFLALCHGQHNLATMEAMSWRILPSRRNEQETLPKIALRRANQSCALSGTVDELKGYRNSD